MRALKIHPALGVARLGNSPEAFFVGPERPGDFTPPAGGYRDDELRLKRQAARFRVFVYEDQAPPRELGKDEAEVTWTVHLANTKAAADRFYGVREPNPGVRNKGFTPRDELLIDPGPGSISGVGQKLDLVNARKFMGHALPVKLGTLMTDEDGRLLVLGGHGQSGSPAGTPLDSPGSNFANHDGWYDDVSDGPVTAIVRMNDGSTAPEVAAAWVVVGPPKFAPGLQTVVTLYDTLLQVAIDRGLLPDPFASPEFKPSFADDIYPVLRRAVTTRWVYASGQTADPPSSFHFFRAAPDAARIQIFRKLGIPAGTSGAPATGGGNMPRMWSDHYPQGPNGTLTRLQYKKMQAWRNGAFTDDWTGQPPPPGAITPAGLDRAGLESCVGGPFYPGIEASWKLRDEYAFVEPFRLDVSRLRPGDVSRQMSLPWQSDFLDCAVESGNTTQDLVWWPAQRPIDVWTAATGDPLPWGRAFDHAGSLSVEEMVTEWHRLGLVLEKDGAFLETARVDQPQT